jgi:Flp pilus assembly protein TadG
MKVRQRSHKCATRGFVLVTSAVVAVILLACLGLCVDLGRIYLVKSEAQNYADAAALTAALQMDATPAGLTAAANAVAEMSQKYDLQRTAFAGTVVEFAVTAEGPWSSLAGAPLASRFVRVTANANIPLYFLPIATLSRRSAIRAQAVAGQVPKTTWTEGLFPFSPIAHSANGPDFGLLSGALYTLRWPENPAAVQACPGDQAGPAFRIAAQPGAARGYFESDSANGIRQSILNGFQTMPRTVGDLLVPSPGEKRLEGDAIAERIRQDSDPFSETYDEYAKRSLGNGRRLVECPIRDGGAPPGGSLRIIGVGAFLLQTARHYDPGPGSAWCAEYAGAYLEGAAHKGVATGGGYAVRLVR